MVRSGRSTAALEVSGGGGPHGRGGLAAFERRFGKAQLLMIGAEGIEVDEFLLNEPLTFIARR